MTASSLWFQPTCRKWGGRARSLLSLSPGHFSLLLYLLLHRRLPVGSEKAREGKPAGQSLLINVAVKWSKSTSVFTSVCALSRFSHVWRFATPWTVAPRLLVPGIFRQEYWSGLSFSILGDLPDPGIEHTPLLSPALAGKFLHHLVSVSNLLLYRLSWPGLG